jgi:hypothetical protein
MLKKHMVANRIDEGSKALRLAQAAPAHGRQNAREGLLAHVLDGMRGLQPGSKLELDQLRKICSEVLLRPAVAGTEIMNVNRIE